MAGRTMLRVLVAFGDPMEAALPSVDLTVDEGCTGPPWYFWAGPGSYLVSLSASPAEDGALVVDLFAGEQREGFATC